MGHLGEISVNKKGWCEKGYPEGSKGKTHRIWTRGAAPRRLPVLLSFGPLGLANIENSHAYLGGLRRHHPALSTLLRPANNADHVYHAWYVQHTHLKHTSHAPLHAGTAAALISCVH